MESCSNQKRVKQIKIYFRFFKIATLCLDDSFAHSWHSLNQLQMFWPPQSPDLNPIEMVWDELDRRVKEKQPTGATYMWELLQNCWKSIPLEAG